MTCCRCVFVKASSYILNMNIFICLLSVYSSDVIDRQCSLMDSGKADTKAVIILVPVRLGGERTNMDYLEFVKVWNESSIIFQIVALGDMKSDFMVVIFYLLNVWWWFYSWRL